MKAKKSEKLVENLKTVAICLLFLCAIALSALYFYRSGFIFSRGSTGAGNIVTDTNEENERTQFDGLIIPESIAAKSAGKHTYAITQGEDYMQLIYRRVCENLSIALSENCSVTASDSKAWEEACLQDDFILVKYHAPLSHTVIYADAASNLGEEALKNGLEENIGAIDQIFIFPDKTDKGDVFALTRGKDGEIFALSLNDGKNTEDTVTAQDLEIYVNASAMTLADLYCHVGNRKDILCSTILHSLGLNSQKIVFSQGYEGILEDTATSNLIASFFDINPDKSGNYFDEKTQSTVYVATHGTLHVSELGVSYSSAGETGGIPLSNYSDAFSKNAISTAEAIVLAQSFISGYQHLDRRFLGGDAHPVLSAVYSDNDGRVTLEYIYCLSNVEIEDSGTACRLTLKDGRIIAFEATANLYHVSDSGERRHSLSPEWVINMSLPQQKDGLYTLKYRYRTSDMLAEWSVAKTK